MDEIISANGGSLSLLRSANPFDKFCSVCDDFDSGIDVSGWQEVGTVVHTVSWVMAGLAMMFNHVLLLVPVWLCGSAYFNFGECANAARLFALYWLACVRWAISCGQSGNVDSLICVGGGAGTLGSEAGTLGGNTHSLVVDDGALGATL